jgi:hypothetical protein
MQYAKKNIHCLSYIVLDFSKIETGSIEGASNSIVIRIRKKKRYYGMVDLLLKKNGIKHGRFYP